MLNFATTLFFCVALTAIVGIALRRAWLARMEYRRHTSLLDRQLKWVPVEAKILRLGYGIDYGYPGLVPPMDGVDTLDELEDLYRRQIQIEDRHIRNLRHQGIYIAYAYDVDGVRRISRSIAHVVLPSDANLIYGHEVGTLAKAYLNPMDRNQSILRMPGRADRRVLMKRALVSLKLDIAILATITAGVIYVFL